MELQMGISKSVFGLMASAARLLTTINLSFDTENCAAMLSRVSFSWT